MRLHSAFKLALSMTLLAVTPLLAQGRCVPTDTIAGCFDRYLKPDTARQAAKAQEKHELERQPAGMDTGGANLATNKKNLLPLLAFAGLLGEGTGDDAGTMVLDLNFLLPKTGPEGSRNAQLQAVASTQPQIFGKLRDALPEEERDKLVGQLEERIGDLADSAIRFTYNHASRFHGRTFGRYAKRFDTLSSAATQGLGSQTAVMNQALLSLIAEFQDVFPVNAQDAVFQDLPPEVAGQALRLVEENARELAADETRATRAMGTAGLSSFHKLLDNQPQFHVTAVKKLREPLVGPDELAVKVTYEWSAMNFNRSMPRDCHRALDVDGPDAAIAAACLGRYTLFVAGQKDPIEKRNRVSFSGEYTEIDGETIDARLPGIDPIVLERAHKLIVSAGWSRDFSLGEGGPVAVDLLAEYQDITADPLRRDRGIVTLTFTRQFGNLSIPLGIVYANHGEFLTDIDERLSAHVGIRFSAFGGNGDEQP